MIVHKFFPIKHRWENKVLIIVCMIFFFGFWFMITLAPESTESFQKKRNLNSMKLKIMGTISGSSTKETHSTKSTTTTTTGSPPTKRLFRRRFTRYKQKSKSKTTSTTTQNNIPTTKKQDNQKVKKPTKQNKVQSSSNKPTNLMKSSTPIQQTIYKGESPGWSVIPGGTIAHFGDVKHSHDFPYIIEEKDICKDFDMKRTKVLIFIPSLATEFEYRTVIRQTWGLKMLQKALNFRLVFLLSNSDNKTTEQTIYEEASIHGDIVQENFADNFGNLAKKTVMGLKWTLNNCKEADFVMKTDVDVLIHVPNLFKIVEKKKKDEDVLLCKPNINIKIYRGDDINRGLDKYYVPKESVPGLAYPPYCAGLGYVMSQSVVKKLFEASLVTPELHIEDVYMTGVCRRKTGIEFEKSPFITNYPKIVVNQGICAFKDGRVTSSELGEDQIRQLWHGINTKGFFCLIQLDKIPEAKNFI